MTWLAVNREGPAAYQPHRLPKPRNTRELLIMPTPFCAQIGDLYYDSGNPQIGLYAVRKGAGHASARRRLAALGHASPGLACAGRARRRRARRRTAFTTA